MEELSKKKIEKAVDDGVECYLQKCKNAIDDFVLKYFSFKGTWQLHKKALGKDLYRVPLNIAWAVPYLVSRTGHFLLHKMGEEKFLKILEKIPPGFKTDVQKEVEWLIVTELLQLPYKQDGRESNKDGLLASILEQDLRDFCRQHLPPYAVPKIVEFREELPLTVSEKVFKKVLREQVISKMKGKKEG